MSFRAFNMKASFAVSLLLSVQSGDDSNGAKSS